MFVDPGELYAKSRSMFCSMGSPLHVWFQPHAWQAQFDAFTMRFFFAFHRADILPSKGLAQWSPTKDSGAWGVCQQSRNVIHFQTLQKNKGIQLFFGDTHRAMLTCTPGLGCFASKASELPPPIKINPWRATGLCDPSLNVRPTKLCL